jgi:Carboxypeptidase regulatory-like domain
MSDNLTVIAGVVVDAEGKPVEEARVYFVEGPVPLADIAALTDSSGRFALSAPVSGTYQLGVAFEGPAGFRQKTKTVEVGEERDVDLEVRLDK